MIKLKIHVILTQLYKKYCDIKARKLRHTRDIQRILCGQREFTERLFVSFGHHSSLWPKTATFESSQRGYSCPSATTVHCGQRPQHLRVHRESIHVLRPPQFIVAKDSNIWEFTERLFMTKYHHSLLWPNATTFERSQRVYLQPKSATVPCDQRPHHSRSLSSAAAVVLMPLATSFLVAWVPAAAATNLQNSYIPFKYIHLSNNIGII